MSIHTFLNGIITRPLLAFWLLSSALFANADKLPSFQLAGTQIHTLQSKLTGVQHSLVVSLPQNYQDKSKAFPVLLYLDGYWDAPLVHATYGNLAFDRAIPELIMVGMSLPDEVAKGAHRDRFFSPTSKPSKPLSGQALLYYRMLIEEALPYLDKHFRTDKSRRTLAGQSMGGLFTLTALQQTPPVFSRFVAINPAISWDTKHMLKQQSILLKQTRDQPVRLFISYGEQEFPPFRDATVQYTKQLNKKKPNWLHLKVAKLEGMRHTGGKGEAYAKGMLWAYKDIAPQGKSGLEAIWPAE